MATRTSFRPRPVDVNKQLTIVRDLSELDTTDGLLPKEPEPAAQQQQQAQGDGHHADAAAGSSQPVCARRTAGAQGEAQSAPRAPSACETPPC